MVQEPLAGFEVSAIHQAWPLPTYDLLESYTSGSITDEELKLKSRLIEDTLASFKVEAQVVGVNTGPAVTQFELQPAVGVKVSKITTLERDLALALAAHSMRIEAPLQHMSKAEIAKEAVRLGLDAGMSWSCYDPTPDGLHCGLCDSCRLRAKGYVEAGLPDPTRYAAQP